MGPAPSWNDSNHDTRRAACTTASLRLLARIRGRGERTRPQARADWSRAICRTPARCPSEYCARDASAAATYSRLPPDRRVQVVALTEAGEAAFARLRDTAIAFDTKLRAGLADADLATLSTLLGRLAANVGAGEAAAPWVGLADRRLE